MREMMESLDAAVLEPWISDLGSWTALAQLLEDLRQSKVVPFLGAGVSQAIGFPGWSEAVLRLGRVRKPDLARLPGGDPLYAADRFRQSIPDDLDYLRYFQKEFGCAPEIQERIRSAPLWRALAFLPCADWITLNYDSALEYALQSLANRRTRSVNWADRSGVNEFLLGGDSHQVSCVHLHGLVPVSGAIAPSEARNFVLTEQEYQQRYLRSDEDRSKLFVVFTSKVLLFVGCSLTDLDLMGVLREVKAKLGYRGHRHYALLASASSQEQLSSGETDEQRRNRLRLKYGVEAIFFDNPDRRFAGLVAILEFLSAAVARGQAVLPLPAALRPADDQQKGRWGMQPVRGPYRASVVLQSATPGWFGTQVLVTGPGDSARFHLHPSFPGSPYLQPFKDGKAVLPMEGWGAFTLGIEVADQAGQVWPLELDLAACEELPWDFREA